VEYGTALVAALHYEPMLTGGREERSGIDVVGDW
jgi:hypothetical protein